MTAHTILNPSNSIVEGNGANYNDDKGLSSSIVDCYCPHLLSFWALQIINYQLNHLLFALAINYLFVFWFLTPQVTNIKTVLHNWTSLKILSFIIIGTNIHVFCFALTILTIKSEPNFTNHLSVVWKRALGFLRKFKLFFA
jgi:hypothetical protein